jgi:hypothetical protein
MTTQDVVSAEDLRAQTVAMIDRLGERSEALGLGPPPDGLGVLREKLAEDRYRVPVFGAASRGKSLLINAVLGTDALPTDLEPTTAQIFRVRNAAIEGYRLRFEDGSSREIGREDLARYGSQVAADAGQGAAPERILRWIEVDVPAAFLPDRVELLDTCGLGTMYAGHAELTSRIVPEADAVIFVLESGQPAGQADMELLERIVKVTPRVFFVQTKIDQFAREAWEATRERSEAVLRERFGDRLVDPRVWPVSSTNLRAAADSDHPDALLFVSRYQALADALREFLAEMCAAPRAVAALVLAAHHLHPGHQVLSERLAAVTRLSEQEAAAHRAAIAERRGAFEAQWGTNGTERRELQRRISRVAAISKQEFRETMLATGPIARELEARIEAVEDPKEANALGEELAGEVVSAALQAWTRIGDEAKQRYADALRPLLEASAAVFSDLTAEEVGTPAATSQYVHAHDTGYDTFRGIFSYSMPMHFAAGIVITTVAAPLAIAAAAGGVLWAAAKGWTHTRAQQQRMAKAELTRYMRAVLQDVSQHFLSVDLSRDRFSRADEYFNALEGAVNDQVVAIVERRLAELRDELAHLEAQAQLDTEARTAAAAEIRERLAEWEALAGDLQRLLTDERVRGSLAAMSTQPQTA